MSHEVIVSEDVTTHYQRWSAQMTPAGRTYRKLAESAVERLYARTGMDRDGKEPPAIFWCESFYQMMTLPSLVLGILHSDIWDVFAGTATTGVDNKQWTRKWNKEWPEIWLNAGMPLLKGMNTTARIAGSYGHLEPALVAQTKRELGLALRSGRLEAVQRNLNREMYRRYWARLEGSNFAKAHWGHTKHDVYAELGYIRNRTPELELWEKWGPLDVRVNETGIGVAGLFSILANRLGAEPAAQERRMVHVPAQVPWLATGQLLLNHWPEQCNHIKDDVQIWLDLAESCSAITCLEGLAFICQKADGFHLTSNNRLHNAAGPALTFQDGFAEWAWEGILVPQYVVEQPELITVQAIETCDAEVRRVMLERYGSARYVVDAGIDPVHEDDFGTLYRKELPGDEALVMVKVVNSTAEPDGTFKDYFLRVPPNLTTAKEAVAWTFGFEADEYDPSIQT